MGINQEIISKLSLIKPILVEQGIERIGVFGSRLRGENKADSDLDILLHFRQGCENFSSLNKACDLLETSFPNLHLDIVTLNGLSPYLGPYILKEVVYV
jgi:predicted nucleotidyltransferase